MLANIVGNKQKKSCLNVEDPRLQQKLVPLTNFFFFCRQIRPKVFGGERSGIGVTFSRGSPAESALTGELGLDRKDTYTGSCVEWQILAVSRGLLQKTKYCIPSGSFAARTPAVSGWSLSACRPQALVIVAPLRPLLQPNATGCFQVKVLERRTHQEFAC